jgi:hypothetical protein
MTHVRALRHWLMVSATALSAAACSGAVADQPAAEAAQAVQPASVQPATGRPSPGLYTTTVITADADVARMDDAAVDALIAANGGGDPRNQCLAQRPRVVGATFIERCTYQRVADTATRVDFALRCQPMTTGGAPVQMVVTGRQSPTAYVHRIALTDGARRIVTIERGRRIGPCPRAPTDTRGRE